MKFGVSFSADHLSPLPNQMEGLLESVEGYISTRHALLDDQLWNNSWQNLASAAKTFGAENVSFHFPVYQCCYMSDAKVQARLFEAYARAADLGLAGVTVCSNQIQTIVHWQHCDISEERFRLVDLLTTVKESKNSETWLALENMPLFSDGGSSPLFCQPGEFSALYGSPIKITWDFANFVETLLATSGLYRIACDSLPLKNIHGGQFLDFTVLKDNVVHWHFSAIEPTKNPENPDGRERKVSPAEGILPESIYRSALEIMINTGQDSHVIFELSEKNPSRMQEMLIWAESIRIGSFAPADKSQRLRGFALH
jgi:hypothetical protein